MEGLGSEQSGGGNAEVRALRAQVREQSLRIAQLEEQLEKAQAFADVKSLIQALNRRVQSTLRRSVDELSVGLQALDDALVSTEPFFDESRRPDPYLSNSGRKGTAQRAQSVDAGRNDGSLFMSTVLDDSPLEEEEEECDEDNHDDDGNNRGKGRSIDPLIFG